MNQEAFFRLSYGLYIVTTNNKDCPQGCVANAAMQITSSPQTIALSINCDNYTNKCIKECGEFALCVLGEKVNPLIIGTFGFRSGKDFDKFASFEYERKNNLPILKDACAYFTCKVINTVEAGTHSIFLARITDCNVQNDDTPMTYSYYHNVIKGKSPKNAPTYIES